MLRNVLVSDLIKALMEIQRESPLCNIEIDEEKHGIILRAVRDPSAIKSKTDITLPEIPIKPIDFGDLGKIIV